MIISNIERWARDIAAGGNAGVRLWNSFLGGVVAGTASASRALVLGASKDIDTLQVTELLSAGNNGTSAATSVIEYGDGFHHITVLTATTLALPDTVTSAASKAVGDLIYTFPAGAVLVDSIYANLLINPAGTENDAVVADVGVGTTIATGAVAILSGTAGFEDFITGQDLTVDSSNILVTAKQSTAGGPMFIATGDDHTLHTNVAAAWQTAASATIDYTGVVIINWKFLE